MPKISAICIYSLDLYTKYLAGPYVEWNGMKSGMERILTKMWEQENNLGDYFISPEIATHMLSNKILNP